MIELKKWSGSFIEDGHRYFREDGKELNGITGMIKTMLFPDEYKGVSTETLMNAADRGHRIHSQVELYDNVGVGTDIPEVANYARLKELYNLEWVASEYLVSDNENFATAIDKVYHIKGQTDDMVALGDIKTTSRFNREYVSWQLSTEAYFFELLNPHLVIGELFGIWLREDRARGSIAKVIPVERKPVEVVKELIRCSLSGEEFKIERMPGYISENLDRLIWIAESISALTAEKEEITKAILEGMQKDKRDKVDTGVMLFTRKAGAVTNRFDSKKFKEEHSDLYEQYVRQSVGQETLQVKLRETTK